MNSEAPTVALARNRQQARLAELGIAHALRVFFKVVGFGDEEVGRIWIFGGAAPQYWTTDST